MTIKVIGPAKPIRVYIGQGRWKGSFGLDSTLSKYIVAIELPQPDSKIAGLLDIQLPGDVARISAPETIVDRYNNPVEPPERAAQCVFFPASQKTSFSLVVDGTHSLLQQPGHANRTTSVEHLQIYFLEDGEKTWITGPKLSYRLDLRAITEYPYPLAVDLGTTNTCAAFIAGEPASVRLFQFKDKSTTPSLVLYDGGNTYIGDLAMQQLEKIPIRSFKRNMGTPKHRWNLENGLTVTPKEVYRSFLQEYLGEFEAKGPTRLRKIGATCPPDYSNRAKGAATEVYESLGKDTDLLFKVDEASAAAVFYIWERIKAAGFDLNVYRAKYTEDHTMMVFDLGGGTTDISVVNARVNTVTLHGANVEEVHLRVMATASLMNVGGDNFTLAVLKSIKCRWALLAATNYRRNPSIGEQLSSSERDALIKISDSLEKYQALIEGQEGDPSALIRLEEFDKLADFLVPTAWRKHESGEEEDVFLRENAHRLFHNLWQRAEEAKINLVRGGRNGQATVGLIVGTNLERLDIPAQTTIELHAESDLYRRIRPLIARAVHACRALAIPPHDREVKLDSIQLAGNSSKIDIVKEMMKSEFTDDFPHINKMVEFDPDNAKSSVACGACIASYLNDFGQQLRVRMRFNPIPERLGWEIGEYDPEFGRPFQAYFRVNDKPSETPTYLLNYTGQVKISLYRRRPGEKSNPQFLGRFELNGPCTVMKELPPIPSGKLLLRLLSVDRLELRRGEEIWKMMIPDRDYDPEDPFSGTH